MTMTMDHPNIPREAQTKTVHSTLSLEKGERGGIGNKSI